VLTLLLLLPFWKVYVPGSPSFWGNFPPHDSGWLNLTFWNPIYVGCTWLLIGMGHRRQWLTVRETLMCLGLLLMPYVLHADRSGMQSGARYASVVFPVYIVIARLLANLYHRPDFVGMYFALSGAVLAMNAAMFVAWYFYY
jgi:hypothetical protein